MLRLYGGRGSLHRNSFCSLVCIGRANYFSSSHLCAFMHHGSGRLALVVTGFSRRRLRTRIYLPRRLFSFFRVGNGGGTATASLLAKSGRDVAFGTRRGIRASIPTCKKGVLGVEYWVPCVGRLSPTQLRAKQKVVMWVGRLHRLRCSTRLSIFRAHAICFRPTGLSTTLCVCPSANARVVIARPRRARNILNHIKRLIRQRVLQRILPYGVFVHG